MPDPLDISVLVLTPRERQHIAEGLHLLACKKDAAQASDDELIEVVRLRTHIELDGRVTA